MQKNSNFVKVRFGASREAQAIFGDRRKKAVQFEVGLEQDLVKTWRSKSNI